MNTTARVAIGTIDTRGAIQTLVSVAVVSDVTAAALQVLGVTVGTVGAHEVASTGTSSRCDRACAAVLTVDTVNNDVTACQHRPVVIEYVPPF